MNRRIGGGALVLAVALLATLEVDVDRERRRRLEETRWRGDQKKDPLELPPLEPTEVSIKGRPGVILAVDELGPELAARHLHAQLERIEGQKGVLVVGGREDDQVLEGIVREAFSPPPAQIVVPPVRPVAPSGLPGLMTFRPAPAVVVAPPPRPTAPQLRRMAQEAKRKEKAEARVKRNAV